MSKISNNNQFINQKLHKIKTINPNLDNDTISPFITISITVIINKTIYFTNNILYDSIVHKSNPPILQNFQRIAFHTTQRKKKKEKNKERNRLASGAMRKNLINRKNGVES